LREILRRISRHKKMKRREAGEKYITRSICMVYFPDISVIKSRWMRSAKYVALVRMRNAYKILVEKPEGKRTFGRPRRSL
jgi:hypothetical protein